MAGFYYYATVEDHKKILNEIIKFDDLVLIHNDQILGKNVSPEDLLIKNEFTKLSYYLDKSGPFDSISEFKKTFEKNKDFIGLIYHHIAKLEEPASAILFNSQKRALNNFSKKQVEEWNFELINKRVSKLKRIVGKFSVGKFDKYGTLVCEDAAKMFEKGHKVGPFHKHMWKIIYFDK